MPTIEAAKREDGNDNQKGFKLDIVGKPNPVVDLGIIRMPLDYDNLKVLSPKDREAQIVRRANYVWHLHPFIGGPALQKARDKAVAKNFKEFVPDSQLLPLE